MWTTCGRCGISFRSDRSECPNCVSSRGLDLSSRQTPDSGDSATHTGEQDSGDSATRTGEQVRHYTNPLALLFLTFGQIICILGILTSTLMLANGLAALLSAREGNPAIPLLWVAGSMVAVCWCGALLVVFNRAKSVPQMIAVHQREIERLARQVQELLNRKREPESTFPPEVRGGSESAKHVNIPSPVITSLQPPPQPTHRRPPRCRQEVVAAGVPLVAGPVIAAEHPEHRALRRNFSTPAAGARRRPAHEGRRCVSPHHTLL
jgi:hypothetical protein